MGAIKLTQEQGRVLSFLAHRNSERDGCMSATEISLALGHRLRPWAKGRLYALMQKGLARQVGSTVSGARTWDITEAGRIHVKLKGEA